MATYVYRNEARLTPAMANDFDALNADFTKAFPGVVLMGTSGIRFRSEQEAIFLQRYVPANQVNGRRVYDYRTWRGVLWARISPAGTVAVPDSASANHVLENTGKGAIDFRDSGSDAGVTRFGTARTRWLQENGPRHNYYPEGKNFNEAWHYRYTADPWRAGLAAPESTVTPEAIQQIKEIVDMGDARVISYSKKGPREGIIIGTILGGYRGITGEQWGNLKVKEMLKGVPVIVPTNDREYDICVDLFKDPSKN